MANTTAAPPHQLSQKESDIQMMLASDVHLGTKNCDFQMERYIFKRRNDGIYLFFILYITFLDLSSFLLVWFLVVLVVCLECEKVWVWERERRDFEIWVLVLMCFGEMGIAYLLELVSICEFLFLGFGYFLEILLLFVYVCIFVCMLMIVKINERNCLDVSHSASLDADAIGRFLCIVVRWWRLVQLIPNLGQFVCCVFV